ncbi:MAG: beta-galactosidase [Oscillospiraceae bacterium]|jgi:beta-galactosidase|nr:beta-galactosidase [Oscillospiraceae bacterium]
MLSVQGDDFYLDGRPFKIYSGAMHYFRTLPKQWEDRLRKLKACGFNCVETYVCWNLHEQYKGKFDFSGMLDIARFLKTAQEIGLYAIVRPGPYICSEWEFGGLPAWLLAEDGLRLRCSEPRYLAHVRDFFAALIPLLAPLQHHKGGNIIAVQVENEYGSYGNDHDYLSAVEGFLRENGIETLLFTSDGGDSNMLSGGTLPHLLKTANFGSGAKHNFAALRKLQPTGPLMCAEFWNGWFDHYGEIHHVRPTRHFALSFKEVLSTGANLNVYMFHGGTNFGYMGGANHSGKAYQPTVTSYDYDALLTEWGGYTKKYHVTRKLLCAHRGITTESLPPEGEPHAYGSVALTKTAGLFANLTALSAPHTGITPEYMEKFGQNYGLILYRHILHGDYSGKLFIDGLHDRAWVFVDGEYKGLLWRNNWGGASLGSLRDGAVIDVLVEGMGRVNYGPKMTTDRKGAAQIRIGNQLLYHWEIFPLPLESLDALTFTDKSAANAPAFYQGSFRAEDKADTFVKLGGFTKGYVWVNGFHLGRYWAIGPQQTLYLPAPLLREENIITVLELEKLSSAAHLELTDKADLRGKGLFRRLFGTK